MHRQGLVDPATFEETLLTFLPSIFSTNLVMTINYALSSHAPNEQYLSDPDQGYITVGGKDWPQTGRQTNGWAGSQTDRRTDGRTDRQTDALTVHRTCPELGRITVASRWAGAR
jgi:hypothetical protein